MTVDQAAIEAAKTGDAQWLNSLVEDVKNNSVADAIVEASTRGHVDCVGVLLAEYETRDLAENYSCWDDLLEAFEMAAANGHLEILKLLLTEIRSQPDAQRKVELHFTTNQALLVAAERGHLDVVKFVVNYAKEESDEIVLRGSHALARAISGGQAAVVEYLLELDECAWELQAAFVAAVGAGDNSLADRIYQLYVQSSSKERLFTSLAAVGQLDALKCLYEAGHNDPDLVGAAFVQASETLIGTEVLEFLLGTGRVSPETFDKGFKMAVESTWDDMKAVAYLLGKKRASATAINEAFMVAATRKVLEILLKHGQVRDESIHTVLAKAVVDLNNPFARTEGEDADIIALLYTKDCVSAKMLGKAFVTAASNGKSKLVALLRGDSRISAKMVSEAFAAAATRKDSHLMMSLFDANISADVILTAFSNAASEGRACNVKELVKLLSNKDRVPQEFRHKAFVIAAQLGHDAILRILCEGIDDYWPLAVLKEALAAAKYGGVKTSIRKVICDQLLDPKCPWAPVMKLIENEKGESTDSRVVT